MGTIFTGVPVLFNGQEICKATVELQESALSPLNIDLIKTTISPLILEDKSKKQTQGELKDYKTPLPVSIRDAVCEEMKTLKVRLRNGSTVDWGFILKHWERELTAINGFDIYVSEVYTDVVYMQKLVTCVTTDWDAALTMWIKQLSHDSESKVPSENNPFSDNGFYYDEGVY